MKGLDDIERRVIPARKDIKERKRRRLCSVVGGAKGIFAVGLAAALFLLLVTCNIDSPYTELLMEKVSSDSQGEEVDGARGILDESFGGDGVVTHHNAAGGDSSDYGYSVCVDGSGRIIVAGSSINGSDNDMALWRYLEDGSLDTSFGGDGVVTHHNAAGGDNWDIGRAVCLAEGGRVLVAGSSYNGNDFDLALWCYLNDGSLDASFGGDGVVTHHDAAGGGVDDEGYSLYIDGSGRILVAGASYNGIDSDMALWCYLEDGSLDTSFGTNGVVTHHSAAGGDNLDYGKSVCLDNNNRIIVTGYSYNDSDADMALWCYLEDGSLDTYFGTGGVDTDHNAANGYGNDYGWSVCNDGSGRILVTGESYNDSSFDMAVWRYLEDGSLDTSFGTNGVVTYNNVSEGVNTSAGLSISIDDSNRILVAGVNYNGNDYDMAVWRYLEDGSLDTSFGGDGVVMHHNAAGGDNYDIGYSVCIDKIGRVLVAGYSSNGTDNDMALWRYK
ncbi:MAG: hypothetical protein K9M94_14140 [Spirochaetia bacterium]|nr:hypothetical protein [Spirochaetia bacterium]